MDFVPLACENDPAVDAVLCPRLEKITLALLLSTGSTQKKVLTN